MKLLKQFSLALILSQGLVSFGFAHEGHDQVPGALKANHGGIVKVGKEINLEYVVSGNDLSLFPVTHEGKDLAPSDVKLAGTAKPPKGKAENLKINEQNGSFKTTVDFKGAYRAEVIIQADVKGKKDSFKFQVEKQ